MTTWTLGIDVSHHQSPESMDYERLRDAGAEYCIARSTYGVRPDATYTDHLELAADAGMLVGSYHFFRQQHSVDSQYEAWSRMLDRVGGATGAIYPALDLEDNRKFDGSIVDRQAYADNAEQLCERMEESWGGCMLYLAPGFYEFLRHPKWMLTRPWWIAHYTRAAEPYNPWTEHVIWQYTGAGRLDGYGGAIDINRTRSLHDIPLLGRRGDTEPPAEGDPAKPDTIGALLDDLTHAYQCAQEDVRFVARLDLSHTDASHAINAEHSVREIGNVIDRLNLAHGRRKP